MNLNEEEYDGSQRNFSIPHKQFPLMKRIGKTLTSPLQNKHVQVRYDNPTSVASPLQMSLVKKVLVSLIEQDDKVSLVFIDEEMM